MDDVTGGSFPEADFLDEKIGFTKLVPDPGGNQLCGGILEKVVEVAVVDVIQDALLNGGLEVRKIHHHAAFRVHWSFAKDLQAIAVAVGAPALSRVPGKVVGGLKFEAACDDHGESLPVSGWVASKKNEAAHDRVGSFVGT
jgi:hypothetical protein